MLVAAHTKIETKINIVFAVDFYPEASAVVVMKISDRQIGIRRCNLPDAVKNNSKKRNIRMMLCKSGIHLLF